MNTGLKVKRANKVSLLTERELENMLADQYQEKILHYTNKFKKARNENKKLEYKAAAQYFSMKLNDLNNETKITFKLSN